MKPRYTTASNDVYDMLAKAQNLLHKAEELSKAEPCPSCGGKIVKGGCMMKDGTMKMGCGGMKADMKKGEHHKETMFDTRPGGVQFVSESGGKTFNAQYQTNQSLLDADDVANKGSSSSSLDMQAESSLRNPHDNINRLVER